MQQIQVMVNLTLVAPFFKNANALFIQLILRILTLINF
jgi:hypothetical protein